MLLNLPLRTPARKLEPTGLGITKCRSVVPIGGGLLRRRDLRVFFCNWREDVKLCPGVPCQYPLSCLDYRTFEIFPVTNVISYKAFYMNWILCCFIIIS